jgi:hypothetical protein
LAELLVHSLLRALILNRRSVKRPVRFVCFAWGVEDLGFRLIVDKAGRRVLKERLRSVFSQICQQLAVIEAKVYRCVGIGLPAPWTFFHNDQFKFNELFCDLQFFEADIDGISGI